MLKAGIDTLHNSNILSQGFELTARTYQDSRKNFVSQFLGIDFMKQTDTDSVLGQISSNNRGFIFRGDLTKEQHLLSLKAQKDFPKIKASSRIQIIKDLQRKQASGTTPKDKNAIVNSWEEFKKELKETLTSLKGTNDSDFDSSDLNTSNAIFVDNQLNQHLEEKVLFDKETIEIIALKLKNTLEQIRNHLEQNPNSVVVILSSHGHFKDKVEKEWTNHGHYNENNKGFIHFFTSNNDIKKRLNSLKIDQELTT